MTHTHDTRHAHGRLVGRAPSLDTARHRATPVAAAPVAAGRRRRSARYPPFSHRSRARRATSPTRRARRPSVTASIHPSVPHEKAPCRGPPRRSRIDFFARSDGADGRTDPRRRTRRDGRTKSKSNERNRTNERRSARGNRARARRRDPAVSLPSSFLRSFVRSFVRSRRPEVGASCEPKSQTYRV